MSAEMTQATKTAGQLLAADTSPIEWLDEPTTDAYGTTTVGEWGGYLLQICAMIYNDRLVLTPKSSPLTYDYGWCYSKGGAALLAALVWNPETHGEPVGFIKAVGAGTRKAGETA